MRTLDEQLAAGATPARNRLGWFKTSLIGLVGSDKRVDRWFDGVRLECQANHCLLTVDNQCLNWEVHVGKVRSSKYV